MKKFPWGKTIEIFVLDMEGKEVEIIKYHPYLQGSKIAASHVMYSVDSINESHGTFEGAVIAWMVRQQLGLNQGALVDGICKMLELTS